MRSDPLDFPGATSGDVHTGLGHPGQGQTSTEIRKEGQHTNKREGVGLQAEGGSGLTGDKSQEFKKLAEDRPFDSQDSKTARGGDAEGTESKPVVGSEQLAGERD